MILGYIRCSTLEQTKGATLKEQQRVVEGYAMTRGATGFDVHLFIDEGVSGARPLAERPAGIELLAAVKPGDTIVASKLDRLFRNSFDALHHYQAFKKQGIHLVLFDMGTEPITSPKNVTAKLFFTITSAFADFERERIRERMAEGRAAKLANGGHVGGEAPYGYRIVGSGRDARLEEVEEEQAILTKMRDLRTRAIELGKSPMWQRRYVITHLRKDNVRSRSGRYFQSIQVQRLLQRLPADAVH